MEEKDRCCDVHYESKLQFPEYDKKLRNKENKNRCGYYETTRLTIFTFLDLNVILDILSISSLSQVAFSSKFCNVNLAHNIFLLVYFTYKYRVCLIVFTC